MNSPLLGAVVVETLAACGATDVVLAPGSRNAPLSLALHAADAAGRLRLHVRVDERVAAFTALGLAKASGRPVAVVTTSGTAVANLAPAAMEARAAGVPLLLVTADRPAEAVGTGANQTTDQVGVLGPSALGVLRLSAASGSVEAWTAAVQRAHVLAAGVRTRRPGPVQLNVEFPSPHVGPVPDVEVRVAEVSGSVGATVVELDERPTVVLVGDAGAAVGTEARAAAELAGAPLFAEPSSNARAGGNAVAGYRLLLESELGGRIERVVCFGHPTLSRPVTRLLSRPDVELVVVSDRADWFDVGSRASVVADRVLLTGQPEGWLAQWLAADEALPARGGPGLDRAAVVAGVLGSVAPGDNLFLGSSQTIRDADLAPIAPHPIRTWANRGLAGIDGTLATATGVALATGRPTTVLLGDLTLQHDLGALVHPAQEPAADLRVVVADDDGGAIFETLEQGAPAYAPAFERVFGTPQGLDLAAVGAALGWRATTVGTPEELEAALAARVQGRQLVVARIPRTGVTRS
ncbi:2-succinyl-5-enolpyruvyl-6-hydroxy-3-cyclohexene-1-carboxylic-acid synthase [Tessaracoccus rhinocerotis]|uniref:2-succinyl-5-enolpyruvyl-6-hydroxy-3- cyclohexene-1-carboxylic-acid synthase n=1 Tax=Tessaracoccus rhinocerotis TaxID=1689449 RepID=UPI001FE3900F|nr:2-succinyl-5-enolpyruvyl-6-hydroxy-3-cyclohexene-1-carboxylic-acid synthase [Tessaracoccus rhinocerotis]